MNILKIKRTDSVRGIRAQMVLELDKVPDAGTATPARRAAPMSPSPKPARKPKKGARKRSRT